MSKSWYVNKVCLVGNCMHGTKARFGLNGSLFRDFLRCLPESVVVSLEPALEYSTLPFESFTLSSFHLSFFLSFLLEGEQSLSVGM